LKILRLIWTFYLFISTQFLKNTFEITSLNNLAEEPEYFEKLSSLRKEMLKLRDEWGDLDSEWGKIFWASADKIKTAQRN
jgi:hypothetical protein